MRKAREEWEVWEDDVSNALDSPKVKASGRFAMFKGDVKTPRFLVDCKQTSKASYSLSKGMWDRLCEWARNEGRDPALAVRLGDGSELAVLYESAYMELTGDYTYGESNSRPAKSKSISSKLVQNDGNRSLFVFGNRRLVAFPFERFARGCADEGR